VTIVDRQNTTAINSVVDRLQPTDFYDPTYGSIYAAMCDLHTKGSVVDLVTVADQLGGNEKVQELGGGVFLAEIAARVPTSSHIRQYAEIVQEKKKRRQMIATGRQLASLGYDADTPLIDLMESAEQQFLQLTTTASTQRPRGIIKLPMTNEILQEAARIKHQLGIKDDAFKSGVGENDLFIIATAGIHGVTLVSNEGRQLFPPQVDAKRKIPSVCDLNGISCINFIDLIRDSGAVFGN